MQTNAIGPVPLSPTISKPSTNTESTSSYFSNNYHNDNSSTNAPNNFTKLNWSNHSSQLLQSINSSINQYTDLIISIEGQKQLWNVHKIIFVSGCELIRKLLMEGDGEISSNPTVDSLILTSITPSQLNNLIDYLYNGELKLPKDEIPDFINLCKYFGVKGVEQEALGQIEKAETNEKPGASESKLGKALTMDTKAEKHKEVELEEVDAINEEGSDSCAPGDEDDLNGSDEDTSFSSSMKPTDNTNNSSSFPLDLTNFLNQLQQSNQTNREAVERVGSDQEDDNNEPLLLGQILRNNIESQLMMINGNNGVEKSKGRNATGRGSEVSNSSSTSQLMSTLFQLAQHQQPNASLPSIPQFSSSNLTPNPSSNNLGSPSLSPQPQSLSRVRATDPRPCPKCNKIYRSAHTLRTHLEDKHTTCPGYRCVLCGTVAKSRNSLHSHMSRQHRGISTKDLPVLPMPSPFDPILANQLLNNGGKGNWGNSNADLGETENPNPPLPLQQSHSNKSGRSKHSNNVQHYNDPLYPTPNQMNSGTTGSALLDTYLQFIAENSSSLCVAAAAVAAAVEASNAPQSSNENNVSGNAEISPQRFIRRNHKRKIDDDGSMG